MCPKNHIFRKNVHALKSTTIKIMLFYDRNLPSFGTLNFIKFRIFQAPQQKQIFNAGKLRNFIKLKV